MGTRKPYPKELRDRAVAMVYARREERGRTDSGVDQVAQRLGVHRESVRNWLRQHEIDGGRRAGLSTDEKARLAELDGRIASYAGPTKS